MLHCRDGIGQLMSSAWLLWHSGKWADWWSAAEIAALSSVREVTKNLMVTLTKAPTPQSLSLASWRTLGRVLVIPNVFHLELMEASVLTGTCRNAADIFLHPLPYLWSDTILSYGSTESFLDLMTWFVCALTSCQKSCQSWLSCCNKDSECLCTGYILVFYFSYTWMQTFWPWHYWVLCVELLGEKSM